jgi:hypothetical protein
MKIHKTVTVKDTNGEETKEYSGLYYDRKDVDASPRRIGVSIGKTINLGDYESLRIDVWCAEDIPDGEDKNRHFLDLRKRLDEQLQAIETDYIEDA